jgi:tight adherence protein B
MTELAAFAAGLSAVGLFLYGVLGYWRATRGKAARRVRMRVDALTTGGSQNADQPSLIKNTGSARRAWLERLLAAMPRAERLKRLLAQAGLSWTVETFWTATAVAFSIGFVIAFLLTTWPVGLVAGASCALLPFAYVCRQRTKRMHLFERQFPETLDLISRALRAGHAFGSGLKVAAEEGPEPLAAEFRFATEEINLGLSAPQALVNLADRVPLTDFRFFVTAVLIQRETGGNLTEILGNISSVIRERLKLFANIRVLSAEGRMSAWILIALPFICAGLISVMNPGYLNVLFVDPLGLNILAGGAFMMVVGSVWIRRTVRIRV